MAADVTVISTAEQPHLIPANHNHDHSANERRIGLELLHQCLGHWKCRALLAASEHGVWEDTIIHMGPEQKCISCDISTSRASSRNKEAHTGGTYASEYIFLDILHPVIPVGLTQDTTFPFYLILVDAYSRYTCIYGIKDKSSTCVRETLTRYQADHGHVGNYGYLDIARIRADSGGQFTSQEFKEHCWKAGIHPNLAAPKKQYQNHLAERSWQMINAMARSLLVHAWLPDSFMFHALVYSCNIFNVLPVKGLYAGGHVSTPFELLHGKKPKISSFCVFGCSIMARQWVSTQSSAGKQTQLGIRGIFIGFDKNQKGYLFYSPALRQIYISGDITFDEMFSSSIATTWQLHHDNLALRPANSDIPLTTTTLEATGGVESFSSGPSSVEEGEQDTAQDTALTNALNGDATDNLPELLDVSDDDSLSEAEYDSDMEHDLDDDDVLDLETPGIAAKENISPQPITLRHSNCIKKPNPQYANHARSYEWESYAAGATDQDLARACATEATPSLPNQNNALSWEPAPSSIRHIIKMPNGTIKQEWLKSVRKEIKTLVDSNTFQEDTLHPGEFSMPVMEIFKVKVKSEGLLDKLKTRLVVRGDLQDKNITEDKWSPTASFRSLKMFLAHACKVKAWVKQLDFVGAFLQAKMRTRMFVTIPKIFGILFPEYAWCMGKPVRLIMPVYGTTLCGKYWYLDLLDFLQQIGF